MCWNGKTQNRKEKRKNNREWKTRVERKKGI